MGKVEEPISQEKYWELAWPDVGNSINKVGILSHGDEQRRQRFNEFIRQYAAEARLDELESMKFIKESTGEETHLPFAQYRHTDGKILETWSIHLQKLKEQAGA